MMVKNYVNSERFIAVLKKAPGLMFDMILQVSTPFFISTENIGIVLKQLNKLVRNYFKRNRFTTILKVPENP